MPSEPAGAADARVLSSSTGRLRISRVSSVETVTFIVQTRGSQPPLLEQKAANSPFGSITGVSEYE